MSSCGHILVSHMSGMSSDVRSSDDWMEEARAGGWDKLEWMGGWEKLEWNKL